MRYAWRTPPKGVAGDGTLLAFVYPQDKVRGEAQCGRGLEHVDERGARCRRKKRGLTLFPLFPYPEDEVARCTADLPPISVRRGEQWDVHILGVRLGRVDLLRTLEGNRDLLASYGRQDRRSG